MKALLFCLLLVSNLAVGQDRNNVLAGGNKMEADSLSVFELATRITREDHTDLARVTSIFKWITENISYDTKGYYNLEKIYAGLFHPETYSDSAAVYKNYNDNIVQKVLRERVAICDGYTRLFASLCEAVKIKSTIVLGYVRWYTDVIGEQTKRIHAWNAVQIDRQWYLLDPTWASGYSDAGVTAFKRDYDPYYFLTRPDQLINDHFPLDSQWQILPAPLTMSQFYNQPYVFSAYRNLTLTDYKPVSGVIETTVGGKILFEIESPDPECQLVVLESLVADSSTLASPVNILSGNRVRYEYTITSPETRVLNVVYKKQPALRYTVRIKGEDGK